MSAPKQLILVTGPELAPQERNFLRLADWMGVPAKTVSLSDGSGLGKRLLEELSPAADSLAISAQTLAEINGATACAKMLDEGQFGELLVFDCTTQHQRVLSSLTGGAVSGMNPLRGEDLSFTLPSASAPLTHQLAGLGFPGQRRDSAGAFELGDSPHSSEVILAANDQPVVVRVKRGASQIFLSAVTIPDIDEPASPQRGLEQQYDRLIPVLVFLRHCFGKRCWHGIESTGRLIVDDAVLTEKYGFLDYSVLSRSMQRSRYGASIAFIPWNHWRTSPQRASRIFSENPELTICMHGCDHTNKEFEARDFALLNRKAALAVERMDSHRRQAGAPFEQVMVFPQGRFSTTAIAALRANKYLAAINSKCFPIDGKPGDVKVGDLLRPAVTRYDGFPLFLRRYPERVFDFAFDLFVGRPALVAEHHGLFRDGFGKWEEFVGELHKMDPTLFWPSLTEQLTRSCLRKCLPNGAVEVQFFTRKFRLVNGDNGMGRFLLRKSEPDPSVVQSVAVDGAHVPFSFEGRYLSLELQLPPGEERTIEIFDRETSPRSASRGFGIVHNSGVLIRRGLSEFRDNALARHDGALRAAVFVVKKLKITGDS